MLDILISRLKEEIAIDGNSGSSIDQVWEYVETIAKAIAEEAGTSIAPLIDERYKAFIWDYLKVEKDLEFYENIALHDQVTEAQGTTPTENATQRIDISAPELEHDVVELIEKVESSSTSRKRKTAPKSKKKPTPKKKTSKKAKKTPKKKKRTVTGDSDDDYEAADDSSSSSSESEFEQDTDDLDESEDIQTEDETDGYSSNEDVPPRKKHTSNLTKAPKSANTKPKKTNVKPTLSFIGQLPNLTYDEMVAKYGSRLYVTGSIELQEQQLYVGVPPGANLSPNLVVILQEILKTRNRGLLQADITKVLDIDSRSTGHYCKSLEEKGAIIRNGVSTQKMRTNSCIHARYANKKTEIEIDEDDDDTPYNVNSKGVVYSQSMFCDSLIELVKDAPNFMILSEDLMRALGFNNSKRAVRKWFNRTINELCEKGHIKKTNVRVGSARPKRCIQLVKTPELASVVGDLPVEDCEYPIRISSNRNDIPILSFPVDCSVESQLLQVLIVAGENGCTQKELEFALNTDDNRMVYRMLEKMSEMKEIALEKFGAMRLLEFEGKLRRYRYYTYAAYKKVHENVEFVPQPLPDEDTLGFVLKEKELFIDVPHELKSYQRYMLQSRRELGLVKSRGKVTDPSEPPKKLGRPRKTLPDGSEAPRRPRKPLAEGSEPRKRGRPKKSATSKNAADTTDISTIDPKQTAPTSINTADVEVPTTTAVAPADAITKSSTNLNDSETTATNMDVDVSDIPVNSEPLSLDNTESGPIDHSIELTSNSVIDANTSNQSEESSALPTTLVRRRQSITSSEEMPSKRPKHIINSDENNISTVSAVDSTDVTDVTVTGERSTTDTTKSLSTTLTSPKNVRKKTIADYFTKLTNTAAKQTPTSSAISMVATTSQDPTPISEKAGDSSQTTNAVVTSTSVDCISADTVTNTEIAVPENLTSEPSTNTTLSSIETPTGIPTTSESVTESAIETSVAESSSIGKNPTNEESVDTRGPRNWATNFKKGTAHRNKQINIYMEIRMKVLLAILEDFPMWEIGKDLYDTYKKKATELFGPPKYTVCGKTLWRSASTLAERGEAAIDIIECSLLTGAILKKKILLHKNVDIHGDEYALFKRNLQDRRTYQQVYYHKDKVATIDAPVESLEDRIDRMKQQLEDLNKQGRMADAKSLEARINELSVNAQKFKRNPSVVNMSSWMITGIQFGWIRARMIRIKLLYMHIFGLLTREGHVEGVDKESRIITLGVVINHFTLNLYCNIIGVFDLVPTVVEYVRNPNNAETTYQDMPNEIREELFSNKNKFRRRLRSLLNGLEYLGLITGMRSTLEGLVPTEKYMSLAGHFRVEPVGVIREVKKLGQPIIREHTLDTMTDVTLYWSELQFVSTHVDAEIPPEELEPEPTNPIELEFWRSISHAPGWSNASVYTRSQRKILNSYVDRVKGTTPLKNYSVCADIADEINTSITYVRRYFAKVEVAIERKRLHREEKALERRLKPIVTRASRRKINRDFEGRRVINLSSTRAFHPVVHPTKCYPKSDLLNGTYTSMENSIEGSEELRANGQDLFMDDIDSVPVLSSNTINLRMKRKKRKPWPAEDDELLIYSYVILRHRSTSRSSFRWTAIQQVFPSRDPNQCRNRLHRMLTDVVYMEQLETATNLWNRFFVEGIQNGEIENPEPREMVNFDLLSFLTYFLRRLNDGGPLFKQTLLPVNVADIESIFEVGRGVANANPYYHEDRYYSAPTLVTKMGTLYHQSLSARRVQEQEYDTNYSAIENENNIENRIVNLLKVYSMMCLLTPAETYDPFYAYYVITSYPENLHQLAIDEMRADGALIQSKLDRAIPNTRYGLSAKMATLMAGKLPQNMFVQAKKYYMYLKEQTTSNRFMPEYVSSGMMACLLSLLSENKLRFNIANKTSKMKAIENAYFHSRLTDRSLIALDLDLQVSISDEPIFTNSVTLLPEAKKTSMLEFDIQVNNFLKTQPEDIKILLQSIVDLMKKQENHGLSLYQLKLKIDDRNDDDDIMNAVGLLERSDPPILVRVGFEASRYVLSPYIDTWTISNQGASNLANRLKIESNTSHVVRKDIICPKLWNDVNGYTTDVVLKDCKNVIVDYILRKPGSSEANIYRNFSMAFSRVNLQELLQLLVTENILKKVCLIQQNESKDRKSIFSKSRTFKCTNKPVIERATQTCYWVTNITHM